jgi:hypothetical protein
MDIIIFFILLPLLVLRAWFILTIKFIYYLYHSWKSLIFLYKLTFIFSILQIYFSIKPWIEYDVMFTENIDKINVSSKINLYLIILSLISFYFSIFSKNIYRYKIFIISQFISFTLFVAGVLFPNPILLDFLNKNDYYFNNAIIYYGISCFLTSILSIRFYSKGNLKS